MTGKQRVELPKDDVPLPARKEELLQRQTVMMEKKHKAGTCWHRFKTRLIGRTRNEFNVDDVIQRRFLIDEEDVVFDAKKKKKKREDIIEYNIHDFVDQDDRHAEEYISDKFLTEILESRPFQAVIMITIAINAITIGLRANDYLRSRYLRVFDGIDEVVLGVYACEILLKWYCGFVMFWRSWWNIFDLGIVIIMFCGNEFHSFSCLKILRVLQVLHYLRGLYGFSAFNGMEILVDSVLKSLPDMCNIGILLLIALLILAVAAVNIFGQINPKVYGDLGVALFSLFSNLTQDGVILMYDLFINEALWVRIGVALLMLVNIVLGTFIFLNLIIAVAAKTLEDMSEEKLVEEEEKQKKKEHTDMHDAGDLAADINQKIPLVGFNRVHRAVNLLTYQQPMQLADFKGLTAEKLEKYFLLLAALDENLAEYKGIKADLQKIYDIVKDINIFDVLGEHEGSQEELDRTSRLSSVRPSAGPKLLSRNSASARKSKLKS